MSKSGGLFYILTLEEFLGHGIDGREIGLADTEEKGGWGGEKQCQDMQTKDGIYLST